MTGAVDSPFLQPFTVLNSSAAMINRRGSTETIPPIWSHGHQAALTEILHRTRLISMGLVQPPLPPTQHMSRAALQYHPIVSCADHDNKNHPSLKAAANGKFTGFRYQVQTIAP